MFSFICVWIKDWANNGEAGDLRRYRIHYDVAVTIQAWWRKYASEQWGVIGEGNGLAPVRCQAMTFAKDGM